LNQTNKYAQVLVDVANLDTRTFSYLIPDEIKNIIKIGQPVLVPFGNQGAVNAYIVGFGNYLPDGIKAKSVYEILDTEPLFDIDYLRFAEWVASYYCCNIQNVLEAAIPSNFFSKSKRIVHLKTPSTPQLNMGLEFSSKNSKLNKNQEKILEFLAEKSAVSVYSLQKKSKVPSSAFYEALRKLRALDLIEIINEVELKSAKAKTERYLKIKEEDASFPHYSTINNAVLTKKQSEIVEKLKTLGGESKLSDFLKEAKTTSTTVKKIADAGAIEIFDKEIYRNPLKIFENQEKGEFLKLNSHQKEALKKITYSMDEKNAEPLLLYGVTGSGKTEVYLHAAQNALQKDKTVIILAPEILLASQLAKRISARFGVEKVALWHSNISEGERYDVWERIRSEEVKIIVGARSAIFAPIKNLGLIIIDEEHESSYKQTSPVPRYNAKTVAMQRAEKSGAALVMGSATPDITTYYRAKNTNSILHLPERFGTAEFAGVSVIDMREEFNNGNKSIFSRVLKHNLHRNIEEGNQSLLLINRRGFSTYGQCQNCGFVAECKSCSIPLILHKTTNKLRCHYCNYERSVIAHCPECGSNAVKYSGMGTQRVEEMFRAEFPQARVARIDSDIMTKKNLHIEIIEAFSQGEIDVLIGTQMIAKGLDIPKVTLVGVLMADYLFKMPDFRAGERGFQLLTQVAGRAGRGDFKGKVYFQTYSPEFFAIQHAKEQDFTSFYHYEIQNRNELSYPPFSYLIRLIISSKSEIKAQKIADEIAYKLRVLTESRAIDERLEILGASPCIISKIKDEYRFHIIIKNTMGENGHLMITNYLKTINIPSEVKFLIDVDPTDML
jgi:primosomal protein N' (replication factor Y)